MLLTRRVLFRDLPSSQLCHCLRTRILHTSRQFQFNGTQHSKENDGRFKILFLGRDEFSCLVLRELHRARDLWKEIAIVTQPDMQIGRRGEELSISPLKLLGLEFKHPVYHIPPSKKDFKTWMPPEPFQTSNPPLPQDHLLITASFGRILSTSTLSLFQQGRKLNVHPSLLPKYRGAAPIQWTILGEDEETGVCVVEMLGRKEGEGVDGGALWGMERLPTPNNSNFRDLRDVLGVKGGELLVSTLRAMLEGKAKSRSQPSGDRTPAPRITADHAVIDFRTMSAAQISRMHRALAHQRPLTTSYLYSWSPSVPASWKSIQFLEISPLTPDIVLPQTSSPLASIPGSFSYSKSTKSLYVRCADQHLVGVTKVKPENGKEMTAEAFWNGVAAKVSRAEKRGKKVPDDLMVFGAT